MLVTYQVCEKQLNGLKLLASVSVKQSESLICTAVGKPNRVFNPLNVCVDKVDPCILCYYKTHLSSPNVHCMAVCTSLHWMFILSTILYNLVYQMDFFLIISIV